MGPPSVMVLVLEPELTVAFSWVCRLEVPDPNQMELLLYVLSLKQMAITNVALTTVQAAHLPSWEANTNFCSSLQHLPPLFPITSSEFLSCTV